MKSKISVISSFLFLVNSINAQHSVSFITLDPDGYTNIRKEPNSKSEIIDKVRKYQIFIFDVDCDDDLSSYSESNWLPVSTGKRSGYIYKKNLLQLNKLPSLKEKQTIKCNSDICGKFVNANDSLIVTMYMKFFDKNKHELKFTSDGEHVWSIDGKFLYSSDNRIPVREIKIIEILCSGRKTTVMPKNEMKNLYDPHTVPVHIGQSGELYLNIRGGGGEGQYSVWFSIVEENIVSECFEYFCW